MSHFVELFYIYIVSGEKGTKRDLISTSRELSDMSEYLTHLIKKMASQCTDRRMRTVCICFMDHRKFE